MNFKHLHYFWAAAKAGGIVRAGEQLHIVERYRRPDFSTLEYDVTIDDPGAYTQPFTLHGRSSYATDTELMEYICNENNQDVEHIVGKDPRNKYSRSSGTK